jgi:plasmid maintenance system antidote protein VapI
MRLSQIKWYEIKIPVDMIDPLALSWAVTMNKPTKQTFHDRVKARVVALYRDRKFTQAALAKHLSVDPSAAHGYVHGDTRISLDVLAAVAEVAGVPVETLVAEEKMPKRQEFKRTAKTEAA